MVVPSALRKGKRPKGGFLSHISGDDMMMASVPLTQRKPKSKNGPLGPLGVVYYSMYSPTTPATTALHEDTSLGSNTVDVGSISAPSQPVEPMSPTSADEVRTL